MNCNNCGSPLKDGDKFCTNCGVAVPEEGKDKGIDSQGNGGKNRKGKAPLIVVSAVCVLMVGIVIAEAVQIKNVKKEISEVRQELAWTIKDKDGEIISLEGTVEQNEKDLEEMEARITEQEELIAGMDSILQDKNEEIERLEDANEYYYDEWCSNSEEIRFYETYAGIIDDDGSKRYHTYNCPDLVGEEFFIFNTNEAERQGYYACPKCH